ncbi:MAG TPA: PLP-dependent aspartate aminotransferase family protein [Pyrinomonadaceae bacterium]|jgi:cystathionine gamma-synthase/methionine-gamma-lyase
MAAGKKALGINTQLVHAGERGLPPQGKPVTTPIYAAATFTYDSMAEVDQVFSGEKQGYIYTRYGNPTVAALEEAVRVLEEGAAACAYSTGMAALHAAIFACELAPSATILASQDLYGATIDLLYKIFGSYGIKTITADFSDIEALRAKALEVRPQVLIAETISNPLLKVCDIAACAEIAREARARFIVDNTFTSPYLCQPLKLGADFSVHSATKYMSGHADVMGGVVVARDEVDLPTLIGVMKLVGGILGVWEAHEIHRGLKTLSVRMDRQCANAASLAEYLSSHSRVSRVHYPAHTTAPNPDLVKRVLRSPHAGALVSIELLENSREAAFRFMDALTLCVRSTSLGDVFTGVLHPATASHREMSPKRRLQLGITEGLVRISVGIEDIADIIEDIQQALEKSAP